MKKSKFTEIQIIGYLRLMKQGEKAADVCRNSRKADSLSRPFLLEYVFGSEVWGLGRVRRRRASPWIGPKGGQWLLKKKPLRRRNGSFQEYVQRVAST